MRGSHKTVCLVPQGGRINRSFSRVANFEREAAVTASLFADPGKMMTEYNVQRRNSDRYMFGSPAIIFTESRRGRTVRPVPDVERADGEKGGHNVGVRVPVAAKGEPTG